MRRQGIIFDLDGTLWDSRSSVTIAWNEVLKEENTGLVLTPEDFNRLMGKPMDQIGLEVFPSLPAERRNQLLTLCMNRENKYLHKHPGELYPFEKRTLNALKGRYQLFIVSNCQKGYIEAFLQGCHLEDCFADHLCWGDTGLEKAGSIREIIQRNKLTASCYVGDTAMDQEAAEKAAVPFIFASYGFGQVDKPTYQVKALKDLPLIVPFAIAQDAFCHTFMKLTRFYWDSGSQEGDSLSFAEQDDNISPAERSANKAINDRLYAGDKAGALVLLDKYHNSGVISDVHYYSVKNAISSVNYDDYIVKPKY
jgi:phosphoglycolate phosphatase